MTEALLVCEDGTAFRGVSCGAPGTVYGEVVFNTGMAGYQEVLTDPSYRGQVVAMTAPHVGNYGMNEADAESDRIQVTGFVVREAARRPSSWRATGDLRTALSDAGVVAAEHVDTRKLTRHVRTVGAMRCGLSTEILDVQALLDKVLESPTMVGRDLAGEAGTDRPFRRPARGTARHRVVAVDFGIKRSILANLTAADMDVTVVPAHTTAAEVLAYDPDGVFVSNGPGDPAAVDYGTEMVAGLLGQVPVFGICLGAQLLGQALGGATYKLRFGHRGVNQPVLRRADGVVEITSHNHGFAVDPDSLGRQVAAGRYATSNHGEVVVTHVNLNDDTCEGLALADLPVFGVQYHPEAAPGPHDARYLFERFAQLMDSEVGRATA